VRDRSGDVESLILKLYTHQSIKTTSDAVENDLSFHYGLDHEHIMPIIDAGVLKSSRLFVVRPLLSNSFAESTATGDHVRGLVDAVHFLHTQGRVHGSIRPSNVLIDGEKARLADPKIIASGAVSSVDDIRFTAPELFAGGPPTVEGDYYSLGAILYRVYAGRDPFDDLVLDNLKAKYQHARISSLENVRAIPEALFSSIDGLLQKRPHRRMVAFQELLQALGIRRSTATKAPFVGRTEAVASLQQQFLGELNSLHVTLVDGELGIGKSRLVREIRFRSRLWNARVFSTACVKRTDPELTPIIALLTTIARERALINRSTVERELGPFAQPILPLMEGQLLNEGNPRYPHDRIIQDLVGLTSLLARKEPLRLAIEDVHKADEGTLRFISQLCCRASELNVLLLITCQRFGDLTVGDLIWKYLGSNLKRVTLGRLSPEEAQTLLALIEADTDRRSGILKKADGNPLYLIGCAKNASSELSAENIERIRAELVSPFLEVAKALSVCRLAISAEFLAGILNCDLASTLERLKRLREIGLVREINGTFELRMEELRRAVEVDLPRPARRELHRSLYQLFHLNGTPISKEFLAEHAYNAALWKEAGAHYRELAHEAVQRGEAGEGLEFLSRLKQVLGKSGEKLMPKDQLALAQCLATSGKRKASVRLYQFLLADRRVHDDPELHASVLGRFALMGDSAEKRLALLKQTMSIIKPVPKSGTLYRQLFSAYLAKGDVAGATEALAAAQNLAKGADAGERAAVQALSGELLLHTGHFREALKIFREISVPNANTSASVLTNTAVCLEHLGQLRAAQTVQVRAYRLAQKAGNLRGQVSCLTNLGVFKVKLGDFKGSSMDFVSARHVAQSGPVGQIIPFQRFQAEEAFLHLTEARYRIVMEQLHGVIESHDWHIERLQHQLLLWELQLIQGSRRLNSNIFNESDSPLIVVKRELLRSREEQNHAEARKIITEAIGVARSAGLLYEECRLVLEYSLRAVESEDGEAAKAHAEEGFRIAKKNGYRPLLAQAMMLRGLASGHDREREHWLMQAFKLASEIGLPELIAESGYHIGVHLLKQGHFANGKEHLLKSTAITSDLAEQIPARYRSRYLAKPWRKDARKRLDECVQRQTDGLLRIQTPKTTQHENQFFSALYRTSVIAGGVATVQQFVNELLQTLDESLRRPILLMFTRDGDAFWHSSRIELTDETKKQVLGLAARAQDKPVFDYKDRTRTKGTIAWIPVRSSHYTGGFYVMCRAHQSVVESEIEFLTILGNVTGNALDAIEGRSRSVPLKPERAEFCGIVGKSRLIAELCGQVEIAAGNNATVLIEGETGVGKEVVARAIHKLSNRSKAPFIAVDCGAIPEGLSESELFGAKRGSYTGAATDRVGLFEAANNGTLFLDEISNTNLSVQAKLLRVLQEREVRRVGETRGRPVDVRLVAATNKSLMALVQEGAFRQDLLYRLNVLHLTVPPLRNRREDIPILANHFLERLNSSQRAKKVFGPSAFDGALIHAFPGNVRELQNAVERSFFLAKGATIPTIPVGLAGDASIDEVRVWFKDLSEGRKNFWTAIHERYKRRDIPREKIVALIDLGLRATHGSYKDLASLFRVGNNGYRRLMDFLRRNECLLDFRPYRKANEAP
jgi:transcriptional regulator with GAF, ATPase, and Fis domain/tetratricopeptide (TPR) repeat protein